MSIDRILLPRDGLFCKDGRGWFTSASGHAGALHWPFPSTVRGALRTALGMALIKERGGLPLSPAEWMNMTAAVQLAALLALRRPLGEPWSAAHRMWPTPQDARYYADSDPVVCLQPHQPAAASDRPGSLGLHGAQEDPALAALWFPLVPPSAKPQPPPPWWTDQDFVAWLCGKPVSKGSPQERARLQHHRRRDTRLAINPATQTARDATLYSLETVEMLSRSRHPFVDPVDEWALALRCTLPAASPALPTEPLTLGGKRRLAQQERAPVPADLFAFPSPLKAAFAEKPAGLRVFIITPAHFQEGWLPDRFTAQDGEYRGHLPGIGAELCLRAACIDRPLHASGWDMAREDSKQVVGRAKRTRRLVPPGSVYFFQKRDGKAFSSGEAEALWLAALAPAPQDPPDSEDRADGFGLIVPGVWNP